MSVFVCVQEIKNDRVCVGVHVCLCVCVCERERERDHRVGMEMKDICGKALHRSVTTQN